MIARIYTYNILKNLSVLKLNSYIGHTVGKNIASCFILIVTTKCNHLRFKHRKKQGLNWKKLTVEKTHRNLVNSFKAGSNPE